MEGRGRGSDDRLAPPPCLEAFSDGANMTSIDDDLLLLSRWRSGDQQAGEDLFARHFAGIYRFFQHKVDAEADDLVQRTFAACLSAKGQFRAESTFRTYLFAIARHELYGHLRRVQRNERLDFGVTSIAEIVTSPTSRIDQARQIDQLRGALGRLPADQQLLLELHYWHDLGAAELAEVFEANPGAIRVRLLRARQRLRAEMARLPVSPGLTSSDRLSASLDEQDPESDAGEFPAAGND
jgi:RNA polymerase sigma factor (sigma-70 family)